MTPNDLIKEYPGEPGINYIHWLELELIKTRDENKRLANRCTFLRSALHQITTTGNWQLTLAIAEKALERDLPGGE